MVARSYHLGVRLTNAERESLKAIADLEQRTLSDYTRKVIRDHINQYVDEHTEQESNQ